MKKFAILSSFALLEAVSLASLSAKPAITQCGFGDITCNPKNWTCPPGGCLLERPSVKTINASVQLVNQATKLCLDPKDYGRGGPGTPIQLWNCTNESAQGWFLQDGSVINKGTNLCLDAKDYGRGGAGTPIQLWNCNDEPAQKWILNNGSLVNQAVKLCLDAKDYGRGGAGTPIQLWNCNNEPAQKWIIYTP